jgi:hypothetical protein
MSDLFFSVFKEDKDYTNWQKFIEYVNLHPEFSQEEKIAVKNAINLISSTLGKNFLSTPRGYRHFIAEHFRNFAPWALRWSVWFSDALQDLVKNDLNGKLLSDLKSKNRSEEALTFLEINHYLTRSGFAIEFEQEVLINDRSRFPDLKLVNPSTREVLYIELSSLHMHQQQDWNTSMFHRLTTYFLSGMLQNKLNHCGKIRNLSKENFESVKQQIDAFKSSVISREKLYTIENENLMLAIAGESCTNEILQWAKERQIGLNSVTGDEITFDGEINRIKKKIRDKAAQLGEPYFNIIAISMHTLFMMGGNKTQMLVSLMGYLQDFPHIYGVMIFGFNPLAKIGQDPARLSDWHLETPFGHFMSSRTIADLQTTEFYFSRNPIAKILMPETEEMFYNSFLFGKRLNPDGEDFNRNSCPLSLI